ncbi:uncharacterized protein FOMMEDRAFT_117069 [Fomitiporia mediterranea MF3/22]|uniref:uncharacterized protein n=1 Tax=Fomitiporia mediterranea (strain MF3/22) TaxID=694068 RepID=UPI00044078CB|nr:uncharacterized protein FOMMEDRAFT_117069 [Fomitiporia mediterranea MF3/22]EJD08583.1 hypothetical protein FOMMEDRAFT_117069 [Fomitiporia mediterranea MF3/22]
MSLQVNITGADIARAYQDVLNQSGIDWALFTYDKGTNNLKLEDKGDGGLEELEEKFKDGRIQYAFVRVKDPNTELPKFVQINWCGEGVPESKKGLFHSHSGTVAQFLKGTHVAINARNEGDVTPEYILKRVADSSGSRYTAHKEQPRKFERIAPVGTNYTPIGKVDIGEIRKSATKPTTAAKPTQAYTPPTPTAAPPMPSAPRPPISSKPVIPSWGEPATTAAAPPPPPPMASRPVISTESRPTLSVSPGHKEPSPVASSITPTKPTEEDRIAPVGTNYTPVNLPPPKKLVNPFERMAQASSSEITKSPVGASSAPKKLTWSERQALAKKQQADEEERSRSASFKPISPASTGSKWTPPAVQSRAFGSAVGGEEQPTAPAAPPLPPAASRPVAAQVVAVESEQEPEVEQAVIPPAPPPPPVPQMAALSIESTPAAPPAPPAPTQPALPAAGNGVCAVVLYDYEAEEENEMPLTEGETIEQIEQIDEGWWSGVGAGGTKSGLFPANYVEIIEQAEEPAVEEQAQAAIPPPPPPPPVEPAAPTAPPAPPAPTASTGDQGVCAIALYDYDRAEENELTFREGDRITDIEAASEDWWQGRDAHGNVGLFPANYVEVQE